MKNSRRFWLLSILALLFVFLGGYRLLAWSPVVVEDDPLVRMPGTQPGQVALEAPGRCLNCHEGYDAQVEPGTNWKGSMMAQAARDFLFWACMTVAGQDSIWAIGTPNAVDICERCHFPKGWLEGRSDPTNASLMTGADYDGVQCDFCHTLYDPFFETTYAGTREGADWLGYWDETNTSGTPSQPAADATYSEDATQALAIARFDGNPFFIGNLPFSSEYTENGGGQYFVSSGSQKRASFADAEARHQMFYSRYHKSKYFCSTCHDVSNPALANLAWEEGNPLPTEEESAYSYYHVERTFSEFMLSAYGQQGGAATNAEFQAQGAPDIAHAATCQDCHMRDVVGAGANKNGVPIRPNGSTEHPQSGQPLHDMTGGNAWVSTVLASAVPGSPNYDATNDGLLNQGPALLTLDLTQGEGIDPVALLAGADRARQQLHLAATIKGLTYDPGTGDISFQVQNNSAHKLISGFPEGRRMFVNIKAYVGDSLIYEVNPYDAVAGTLKGLSYPYLGNGLPDPAPLAAEEEYVDELVYEMKPSSADLTGETKTFHFALATGRYKDNRIPPKGFDIANAEDRMSEPVWHGESAPSYYTGDEYAGGYDAVNLDDLGIWIPDADRVEVRLYYQTTSREYIEFLRDEINGDQNQTLPASAYIIQTDPFFGQMRAWGDTIWQLWTHNMSVDGAAPFLMTEASVESSRPTISFSSSTYSVSELGGSATITVTRSGETASTASVQYATTDGSAGPDDYTGVSGSLSFPSGVVTQTFAIPITDDDIVEGNETVLLWLSEPEGATIGTGAAELTIIDDEAEPALSISDASAGESDGTMVFAVTLSHPSDFDVTVDWATSDGPAGPGGASSGEDYTGGSGTLEFSPESTQELITIAILPDDTYEGDEVFGVELSNPANASVSDALGEGTIVDDEGVPTLSIADASAGESDGTMVFAVTLSHPSAFDVTVDWATSDGPPGPGGALSGEDYTGGSGTVEFSPESTEELIAIPILPDDTYEGDEVFGVELSNPANASVSDGLGEGTIVDDEGVPTLSIADASAGESDGTMVFAVTLSHPSAFVVTVDWATSDGPPGPGGASSGWDYTGGSGTVEFSPESTEELIAIPILPDDTYEGDEVFGVELSNPANASVSDALGEGTIVDDEGVPTLSIADASAGESDGTMVFAVTLSHPSAFVVTVDWATSDGPAGPEGASSGEDYTGGSGTVEFSSDSTEELITIPILPDDTYEGDEVFGVELSNPANASVSDALGQGTIVDDEDEPTLSIADASAGESDGTMVFAVTLSHPSAFVVSVDWATSDGPAGPGGASAGEDYTGGSGTVEFSPDSTEELIAIPILPDDTYEGDEVFGVELSSPANASVSDALGEGTIVDDESPPVVSFDHEVYTVDENVAEGFATIGVSLSGDTVLTATVNYETSDGTAGHTDYTAVSGTLVFTPGVTTRTFAVPITDDEHDEPDESVLLTLSEPASATLGTSSAQLTIVDDEGEPTLSILDASAGESDGTMVFDVALSFASDSGVSVDWTTVDGPPGLGGASAGSDYADDFGTLHFSSGTTVKQITITILPDDTYEGDEIFTVQLSNPAHASVSDGLGEGTIVDDESPPVISFDQEDYAVDENVAEGLATISVSLTGDTVVTATVDYEASDGTAGPDDYTTVSGTLVFTPGVTSRTFAVPITDDERDEPDQSVLLTLSEAVSATLGTSSAQITILDDDLPPEIAIGDVPMMEADGTMLFPVTLSAPSEFEIQVSYITSSGADPSSASPGTDYDAVEGTLSIPPNTSAAFVHVPIHNDLVYELDETFTVALSDPVNATLSDYEATGTILNNDQAPQIEFEAAGYTVGEEGATVTLRVTLSGPTELSATVAYATADGPSPDGAQAGSDYVETGGTITFLPGETSHTITIEILNDLQPEVLETFVVILSGPAHSSLGDKSSAVVQIIDDDAYRVYMPLLARNAGP